MHNQNFNNPTNTYNYLIQPSGGPLFPPQNFSNGMGNYNVPSNGIGDNHLNYMSAEATRMPVMPISPVYPITNTSRRRNTWTVHHQDERPEKGTLKVQYWDTDSHPTGNKLNITCVADSNNLESIGKQIHEILGNLGSCNSQEQPQTSLQPTDSCPCGPAPERFSLCDDQIKMCELHPSTELACVSDSEVSDPCECLCQHPSKFRKRTLVTVAVLLVVGMVSYYFYYKSHYRRNLYPAKFNIY